MANLISCCLKFKERTEVLTSGDRGDTKTTEGGLHWKKDRGACIY